MCTKLVNVLRQRDRRGEIEIVASQDVDVGARFPWIPAQAFGESIQLVGPGDETWQGAQAVEQLLRILPRGRWIAWVFRIPRVRPLAEKLYRSVARNRYRLGCGDHCATRPADPASS